MSSGKMQRFGAPRVQRKIDLTQRKARTQSAQRREVCFRSLTGRSSLLCDLCDLCVEPSRGQGSNRRRHENPSDGPHVQRSARRSGAPRVQRGSTPPPSPSHKWRGIPFLRSFWLGRGPPEPKRKTSKQPHGAEKRCAAYAKPANSAGSPSFFRRGTHDRQTAPPRLAGRSQELIHDVKQHSPDVGAGRNKIKPNPHHCRARSA
jgi:hypothetical protein